MAQRKSFGLTRRELEYEVKWALRRTPHDPEQLPKFMGDLMVTLIEKNNMAIATAIAAFSAEVEEDPSL